MGDDQAQFRWIYLDGGNRDAEFDPHRMGQFSINRKTGAFPRKVIDRTARTIEIQVETSTEDWPWLSR